VLFYEVVKAAILKGHKEMEISWILENNHMMNRIIRNLGQGCGVHVYRTYRLFRMSLCLVTRAYAKPSCPRRAEFSTPTPGFTGLTAGR
jgi:hypothetical protein